ncbi:MAG TPA: universal stress protein [Paracoccaceae bacterium]|nr:universal stress protein [Paracoccaceae bacterium]
MTIKRVLLPLAGLDGARPLAECAFLVGRLHQAQVRGLLVQQPRLNFAFGGENADPELIRRVVEESHERIAKTRKQVADMLGTIAAANPSVEFVSSAEEGDIGAAVTRAARLADITVVAAGTRHLDAAWQEVREAALFQSGRPVLVVPGAGVSEDHFDRVVIAWKESIEAVRAVTAAQPFLLHAREVHLLTIGEGEPAIASLADVEQYLQLHYAEIESEIIPEVRGRKAAEVLLDRTRDLGGALLVMGAYSHWRWRQQVFGGVTQAILSETETPVLMAH